LIFLYFKQRTGGKTRKMLPVLEVKKEISIKKEKL